MTTAQPDLAAFEAYLKKYGRSPRTASQYTKQVRLAFACDDPLQRLNTRTLAPKSRHLAKAALSAYARFTRNGDLAADLKEMRLPPGLRQVAKNPLTDRQWNALHQEVQVTYEIEPTCAVIGVMERRGLRLGDVLHLRYIELDRALTGKVLAYEAKGAKRIEFGVLPTYERYLEALHAAFPNKAAGTAVWELVTGGQYPAAEKAVQRRLEDLGEEADIGYVHPHQLRRTYATWFYKKCGRDLEALRQHMGWSNITTAQGYVDHDRRGELDTLALGLDD